MRNDVKPKNAIVAAVQLPSVSDIEFEASLAELRDLEDIREQLDLPAAIATAEAGLAEEPAAAGDEPR